MNPLGFLKNLFLVIFHRTRNAVRITVMEGQEPITIDELRSECGYNFDPAKWHQHPNGGGWVMNSAKVAATAVVAGHARVEGNAVVSDWAKIYGSARISDNARIADYAQVYGDAQVFGNARVRGYANIYDSAYVHGNADISGDAECYGDCRIHGDSEVWGYGKVYGCASMTGHSEVFNNGRLCGYASLTQYAAVSGEATVSGYTSLAGNIAVEPTEPIEWMFAPFYIQGSADAVTETKPGTLTIGCQVHTLEEWLKGGPAIGAEFEYEQWQIVEYMAYVRLYRQILAMRKKFAAEFDAHNAIKISAPSTDPPSDDSVVATATEDVLPDPPAAINVAAEAVPTITEGELAVATASCV